MDFITNPNPILGHITKSPIFFSIQALILGAIIFTIISKKSSNSKTRRLPPGPRQWPVIGNTYGMLTNRPVFKWIHRVMKELDTEIACFNFGGVQSISISCDQIAREALREKDTVFAQRPDSFAVGLLSGGYKSAGFTPFGEQCKKMRKVMVSEMNSTVTLNRLQDKRIIEADNLLAYVMNLSAKSKTVNIREIAQHGCHSVVMRQVFGKRTFRDPSPADGGPGPAEIEHIGSIFQCLEYVYANSLSDYYSWMRGWNVDGYDAKIKEASDVMDKNHIPIIEERIEVWRKKEGKKEVDDWLDLLVSLKDDHGSWLLSPDEIKAQIKEIMVAAVDNPSNNAEWVLAEMLKNPETLKKALDELDRVVGKDRLVQESDIPNLNYIKACSREGYRMHPIAPFLPPRVAREDTTLAGYFVPKGSQLIISRIALGRNPKIWSKPDEFKPERHLGAEVVLAEPDLRFATFSTGRRGCVGVKLGTSMTIMLLARLLQGFNWTGSVELKESNQSLFMAKPLELCVEPRLAPHLYPKIRE